MKLFWVWCGGFFAAGFGFGLVASLWIRAAQIIATH